MKKHRRILSLWCRVFHRKHIRPTPPLYAMATGIKGYCDKCYEFIYCDELGRTESRTEGKVNP